MLMFQLTVHVEDHLAPGLAYFTLKMHCLGFSHVETRGTNTEANATRDASQNAAVMRKFRFCTKTR